MDYICSEWWAQSFYSKLKLHPPALIISYLKHELSEWTVIADVPPNLLSVILWQKNNLYQHFTFALQSTIKAY